jgi:hypothetical protein
MRGVILALGAALIVACGEAEQGTSPPTESAPVRIGGLYHVTGVTIDQADDSQRQIEGRVRVVVESDQYTTHFELNTVFPGTEKVSAKVIGTGAGTVEGNVLEGTSELQIVVAKVPGVDVGFAYLPHDVGPRVTSTSVAEFFGDGSVRVELENQPLEGADYRPTKTILVGYRVEDT